MARNDPWLDWQIDLAKALWRNGAELQEVMRAVGRPSSHVLAKLSQLGVMKRKEGIRSDPANTDAAARQCLRCTQIFWSSGVKNRICHACAPDMQIIGQAIHDVGTNTT